MTTDDVRNDLMDIAQEVEELGGHISSGESCETDQDLLANIEQAKEVAKHVLAQLVNLEKAMRKVLGK